MRFVFNRGFLQLQDMSWYLFGVVFMIGAAFTLKHDRHVRVDIFYVNRSPRTKVWINMLGTIFFLIPFCVLGIYVSWGFFQQSFAVQETSPDPGGLAGRYLAKIMIPTGFGLILLQGIAILFTSILQLRGRWAIEEEETMEATH
jgi:TRAP-type mannitol/chloroaromatic compound transport system permease small subunit